MATAKDETSKKPDDAKTAEDQTSAAGAETQAERKPPAENTPAAERKEEETTPAEAPQNWDSLIPRQRLIEQAREFTGYEPHEVAGALDGVAGQGADEDLFDPNAAKQLVHDWLKKPEEEAA